MRVQSADDYLTGSATLSASGSGPLSRGTPGERVRVRGVFCRLRLRKRRTPVVLRSRDSTELVPRALTGAEQAAGISYFDMSVGEGDVGHHSFRNARSFRLRF